MLICCPNNHFFTDYIDYLLQIINNSHVDDGQLWKQYLLNLRTNALLWKEITLPIKPAKFNRKVPVLNQIRDKRMAEVVLWLIRKYPNEKMIVWAANEHISRGSYYYGNKKTKWMGEYLKDELEDSIYAIGFTGYQGKTGCIGCEYKYMTQLKKTKRNDIETILHNQKCEICLLNIESKQSDEKYAITSATLGKMKKYNFFDGILFLKTISPKTKL